MSPPTIRIALSEADFRDIVAGKVSRPMQATNVVRGQDIEVILSDIGWDRMLQAIEDAQRNQAT